MTKAIIFDLNGVFLQSDLLSERMEKKFGVKAGDFVSVLKKVMEVARKPNAPDSYDLWKPYFENWGLDLGKQEFFDFWFSGEALVPELVDYVDELKGKGYKVFILSNNFRERTEYYRQHFPDLFEKFDGTYFSWETGFVKPQNEAYLNILKVNNLEPTECIYFDDSERNVEVAQMLGIVKSEVYVDLETTKHAIEKESSMKERAINV